MVESTNQSIIDHLRGAGSRAPELHQPFVEPAISSYLRGRRPSLTYSAPPPSTLGISTYKPTPEQLGLKGAFLTSAHRQTTQPASKFGWMDKSFLHDLRRMLHDVELSGNSNIVSWGPRGLTFIIRDPVAFAANIAPKYFNIFSHSTFRMVVQSWCFVVSADEEKGFETYHHPSFVRDDESKCYDLSMQEMKQKASEADASGGSKLEDALLLISDSAPLPGSNATSVIPAPAPGVSQEPRTPSISPSGRFDKTKKNFNAKKFAMGDKSAIKKSSVAKSFYGASAAAPRRGSINNGLAVTCRRGSLTNGTSLTVAPRRTSLTNGLGYSALTTSHGAALARATRRGSMPGGFTQTKPSATIAMLKSSKRRSSMDLHAAVITPFAGMRMGAPSSPSTQPKAVTGTRREVAPGSVAAALRAEKTKRRMEMRQKKSGISSGLNFAMHNGEVINGNKQSLADSLRARTLLRGPR